MLPEVHWIPFVCSHLDFSDIRKPSFVQLENGKPEECVSKLIPSTSRIVRLSRSCDRDLLSHGRLLGTSIIHKVEELHNHQMSCAVTEL